MIKLSVKGAVFSDFVGPKIAITGVPTPAAICMGPESFVINMWQVLIAAINWRKFVLPAGVEIVVVPASSAGPQVRVFDYDGSVVSQFFAYAYTIRGGYHVCTGDVNDDGVADVVVTPGSGLGPQVAMFNGTGD